MIKQLQKVLCALYSHGSRLHCVTASSLLWQKPMLVWQNSLGNTAQFVGSVGDAFSAICRLQIFLPPVNLQNLQLHLAKNSFATASTHLCGIAFIPLLYAGWGSRGVCATGRPATRCCRRIVISNSRCMTCPCCTCGWLAQRYVSQYISSGSSGISYPVIYCS